MSLRLVTLLLVAVTSLSAQQASSRQVAGMEQDMALLRSELARLSQQVADLEQSVAALRRSGANPQAAPGMDRASLIAEVDRRNAALRADLDRALAAFTKQVNQALASRQPVQSQAPVAPVAGPSAPAAQAPAAETPAPPADNLPADMPRTGIRYKVKAGDTLSRIARQNNSRQDWILKANGIANPDQLQLGAEIFIPQP
jgi:nucleoid-associated protein YgaU